MSVCNYMSHCIALFLLSLFAMMMMMSLVEAVFELCFYHFCHFCGNFFLWHYVWEFCVIFFVCLRKVLIFLSFVVNLVGNFYFRFLPSQKSGPIRHPGQEWVTQVVEIYYDALGWNRFRYLHPITHPSYRLHRKNITCDQWQRF